MTQVASKEWTMAPGQVLASRTSRVDWWAIASLLCPLPHLSVSGELGNGTAAGPASSSRCSLSARSGVLGWPLGPSGSAWPLRDCQEEGEIALILWTLLIFGPTPSPQLHFQVFLVLGTSLGGSLTLMPVLEEGK